MVIKVQKRNYGQYLEIAILAGIVFAARILIEYLPDLVAKGTGQTFLSVLGTVLRIYPLTLLMLVCDYFVVRAVVKYYPYGASFGNSLLLRTLFELLGVFLVAMAAAVMMQLMPVDISGDTLNEKLFVTLLVCAVFNVLVVIILDLFSYIKWKNNKAIAIETKLRRQADYRYALLKGQLNPHFLFNSLNVLDYLIHTNQDKASDYVKKLANVYRYQLNMEARSVVTLDEEKEFVELYLGLIKERFGESVSVNIDIDNSYLKRKIVPCGMQMLIENAVKHNVASKSCPLIINVEIEGDILVVSNAIKRKINSSSSNEVGLDNINKQYEILFNSSIEVVDDDKTFTVKIPLFS